MIRRMIGRKTVSCEAETSNSSSKYVSIETQAV